ncbi:hypothetical protein [Scrofimicrobium canadense]|uniref:hypothetical protein n=1 Tax=Scrofimicrobium canadense TaxID=2652290 RepID=UPI0012B3041D|nr:hypothetical protein [Scrofimicrobium canadense]
MSTPTLFTLKSTPKKPKKKQPIRIGRKPQPRTCPTCHQTILTALTDGGLSEQTTDPWTLTLPAIQAAHQLGITIYRAPVNQHGQPQELWWTHPNDPLDDYPKYAWLPAHQCGKPQLPGQPIPIYPPNQPEKETNGPPPY